MQARMPRLQFVTPLDTVPQAVHDE